MTYDPETYRVIYGMNQSDLSLERVVNGTSVELVELMASTAYYYRIVASNSVGSTTSDLSSFTTTPIRTHTCTHVCESEYMCVCPHVFMHVCVCACVYEYI